MANPVQQGLKRQAHHGRRQLAFAEMANPVQQGLKHGLIPGNKKARKAEMANPVQQGLKLSRNVSYTCLN